MKPPICRPRTIRSTSGRESGQEGVEEINKEHDRNGEKSAVPPLVNIAVVVEDNETLDLHGRQKATNGHTTLPTQGEKPANDEREDFLLAARRKLRDLVVLTS